MRDAGEKCVAPSSFKLRCVLSDRSSCHQDFKGRDRGVQGQPGVCVPLTRQLKLCVYRHLCVKIHFSLLNLSNKTGSHWNVKTSF